VVKAIVNAVIATVMSLLTAALVGCYWLLLVLLTTLRFLLLPLRAVKQRFAKRDA